MTVFDTVYTRLDPRCHARCALFQHASRRLIERAALCERRLSRISALDPSADASARGWRVPGGMGRSLSLCLVLPPSVVFEQAAALIIAVYFG